MSVKIITFSNFVKQAMHYQISRGSHSGKILQLNEGLLVPKHFT